MRSAPSAQNPCLYPIRIATLFLLFLVQLAPAGSRFLVCLGHDTEIEIQLHAEASNHAGCEHHALCEEPDRSACKDHTCLDLVLQGSEPGLHPSRTGNVFLGPGPVLFTLHQTGTFSAGAHRVSLAALQGLPAHSACRDRAPSVLRC